MKRNFLLAALTLFIAGFASAQDVTGDWQGTLHAGAVELRLVLHISKDGSGALKATLDSVDQAANGIPVTSISLKDSRLSLAVDSVHGTYEGKFSTDASMLTGTWTQGQPLPLDFKRATAPVKTEHKPAKPSDIDGAWLGTLDSGTTELRIVFHIINTEDGLMATMDSPDQNMKGLPASSVTRSGMSLKIEAKGIGGTYEGKISADLSTIAGTWTQGGGNVPLVLKR
jgi:hypothetical protein